MASSRRIEKVSILLREVIAGILAREISFPEGALVTVTRVVPSEDLYYATVFVTVLSGEPSATDSVRAELERTTGLIQHDLNRKVRMRPVPKITFALDKGEQHRERVEKLLSDTDDQER